VCARRRARDGGGGRGDGPLRQLPGDYAVPVCPRMDLGVYAGARERDDRGGHVGGRPRRGGGDGQGGRATAQGDRARDLRTGADRRHGADAVARCHEIAAGVPQPCRGAADPPFAPAGEPPLDDL